MRTKGRDKNNSGAQQTGATTGFRGNKFTIEMPSGWEDKTIYTISGPVEDEIQHNIVINVGEDVEVDSVTELADLQIESLEMQLQGFHMLKRGEITLNNGQEAYEAIYRWEPTNVKRLYQRQIYVLAGKTAYTLTSTFSKKTRKTRGPEVHRILMSFQPEVRDE
jgi:hypothetical protein